MYHLMNIFQFYIDIFIGRLAPLNSFFGNQKSYSNLRQANRLSIFYKEASFLKSL